MSLEKIHAQAIRRFDEIWSAMREEREQCIADRRFHSIPGAQWEGSLADQFENKPRFEVNKVHLAIIRIIDEYRLNRISVQFLPKDGTEADDLADTCNALFRSDEQDSCAEEAYDNAFQEAVGGGFGAFRLTNEFEEESGESEQQRIRFVPIFDADISVFFDMNAMRQDKSDAKYCFVLTAMTREAYEEQFGQDAPVSLDKKYMETSFDWITPDYVYIAEYYVIEEVKEKIEIWRSLEGEEIAQDEDAMLLKARGYVRARTKTIKARAVHKYIIDGARVVEDLGLIAGKHIPIIPVYGQRDYIDGIERCKGEVRLAKDAQRIKNMQISKLGEISALSSVEKPIFIPEQIIGHEVMWEEDNIKNYPYLLVNPIVDAMGQKLPAPPIAYTKPPQIPPALAGLLQVSEQDIKEILGNQQEAEKVRANFSAEALELVQQRLDKQAYIYVSNMVKAVRRAGEVWLSMAMELYTEEGRAMKGINRNDVIHSITLKQPSLSPEGDLVHSNDISRAKYSVTATVGVSSSSKRQATVKTLANMLQVVQDPETQQVLSSMALLNMEGEGMADVRAYFRKRLLRMGVLSPTPEEAQQLQEEAANAQEDPEAQYLRAAAAQAAAEGQKAQANTALSAAKAEQTKAETAKTLAEIDQANRKQSIEAAKVLFEEVSRVTSPRK